MVYSMSHRRTSRCLSRAMTCKREGSWCHHGANPEAIGHQHLHQKRRNRTVDSDMPVSLPPPYHPVLLNKTANQHHGWPSLSAIFRS